MRPLILLPALALALAACGVSQTQYPAVGGGAAQLDPVATRDAAQLQVDASNRATQAAQAQATATAQAVQSATQAARSATEWAIGLQSTVNAQLGTQVAISATLAAQHATETAQAQQNTRLQYDATSTAVYAGIAATNAVESAKAGREFWAFAVYVGKASLFAFAAVAIRGAWGAMGVLVARLRATPLITRGGGQEIITYLEQPNRPALPPAQTISQVAPPARDERTARALQFLEVAIACAKNTPNWPPNRVPTHIMLRDFKARDFYSGSSWQQAVNLFGELIHGTPGKGAFVAAPTLEEFYRALAAGKVALPQ